MTKLSTSYAWFPLDAEKHERKKEIIDYSDKEKLSKIICDSVCWILTTRWEWCISTRTEWEWGMHIDYIIEI